MAEIDTTLRYTVAILDFHGTFTSNRGRLAHSLNIAFQDVLGRCVTPTEFATVFQRAEGVPAREIVGALLNGHHTDEQKQHLVNTFGEVQKRIYIPKHLHLLRKLKELGVLSVILTNGKEQAVRDLLLRWKVIDQLAEVYGRGDNSILVKAGIPEKPHPSVIDFVIDDLRKKGHRLRRDQALMVGDYQDDIGAGNSAGVHTAFLVTGPHQKPEYYTHRPTYALLDTISMKPASEWLSRENVFLVKDLPDIMAGKVAVTC